MAQQQGTDLRLTEITENLSMPQKSAITGQYTFTLCVAVPSGGLFPVEFWIHFQKVIKSMPRGVTFNTFVVPRKPVGEARTHIFNTAINVNAKYLFMLDDDSIVPVYAVRRMIELADRYGYDAITGIAWPKGDFTRPTIYKNIEEAGMLPGKDWNFGDLFQVQMAGLPACLIRVDALRIYKKYMEALYPDRVHPEKGTPMIVWDGEWMADRGEGKPPQRYDKAEDFYVWYHWNMLGLKVFCDSMCCVDHVRREDGTLWPRGETINDLVSDKMKGKRFYQIDNPLEAIRPDVTIRQPEQQVRDDVVDKILAVATKPVKSSLGLEVEKVR